MSSGIASAIRRTSFLVLASYAAAASGLAQTAPAANLADPPRVFLDTTYVPTSGATIAVPAGGNFQAALDQAQPNHGITLAAGATSSGNFTLPAQAGTGWIVIRTSAPDANFPPPGTRITSDDANVLRKIVTPNSGPAITAALGAHHYRFVGVEIPVGAAVARTHNRILFGDTETALDRLRSRDAAGNLATSADSAFTTPPASKTKKERR